MPKPQPPYTLGNLPTNYFDGGKNLAGGSSAQPSLTELLQDFVSRIGSQEGTTHDPVATVVALRAVTTYADQMVVFCEAVGQYRFESTSAAADDGDLVVQPTGLATGRWLLMSRLSPNHHAQHETGAADAITDLATAVTLNAGAGTLALVETHEGRHGTGGADALVDLPGTVTVATVATRTLGNVPTDDEIAGLSANAPTAANPVATKAQSDLQHDDLGIPAAAAVAAVHANYDDNGAAAFPGPITDPDVPRNVACTFSAGWGGGDITIDGTDQFANVIQEVIADNPGVQVLGVEIFATVTAITKELVGAGGQSCSVDTGDKLGTTSQLAGPVGVIAVDGVTEAGTWDAIFHAVTPTTVPNAARQYNAFYQVN